MYAGRPPERAGTRAGAARASAAAHARSALEPDAQGELARGHLAELRVPELRSPRQMRLVYRRDGERSHAAQALIDVARAAGGDKT